ncbi:myeloid cell nuclear differentiation antigen [Erethizon dorsatum]
MANMFKEIVLLQGLYPISDDHFRIIKYLLACELKLNKRKREEYDRIKVADLMAEKFKSDAGLGKLIVLFKKIKGLEDTAKNLRKEKAKVLVKMKRKGKGKNPAKRSKRSESSTVRHTLTTDEGFEPESVMDVPLSKVSCSSITTERDKEATSRMNEQGTHCPTPQKKKKKKENSTKKTDDLGRNMEDPKMGLLLETSTTTTGPQSPHKPPPTSSCSSSTKKPRVKCVPSEPSEESGYQPGPKEVVVLKVTEPFTYKEREKQQTMIHATVATENAFFRVKVFDITFKDKFTPKNVIAISNYVGRDGFLEIYSSSSVSDVSAHRSMNISTTLIKHANATPKISQLCSQSEGKFVNGIFLVCKKKVRPGCIYYEIQDNTGTMEVVVHGRLANIHCEEGDKLNLTCFQVVLSVDSWQLRSVLHSNLKVIKARKNKIQPLTSDSNVETFLES